MFVHSFCTIGVVHECQATRSRAVGERWADVLLDTLVWIDTVSRTYDKPHMNWEKDGLICDLPPHFIRTFNSKNDEKK